MGCGRTRQRGLFKGGRRRSGGGEGVSIGMHGRSLSSHRLPHPYNGGTEVLRFSPARGGVSWVVNVRDSGNCSWGGGGEGEGGRRDGGEPMKKSASQTSQRCGREAGRQVGRDHHSQQCRRGRILFHCYSAATLDVGANFVFVRKKK